MKINQKEESIMKNSSRIIYPLMLVVSVPLFILGGCAGSDAVKLSSQDYFIFNEQTETDAQEDVVQIEAESLIELSAAEASVTEGDASLEIAIVEVPEVVEVVKHKTPKPDSTIISFAFDQSDIDVEYGELLWQHAQYLKENKNLTLNISGHTDSSGVRVYNEILSKTRAEKVASILIDFGVSKDRIKISGNANDMPLAGAQNNKQHRRVELDYQDQQMVSN